MGKPKGPDTSMGGKGKSFLSTQWSQLLAPGTGGRVVSLRHLAQAYWKPIYYYVRMQRRAGNEEAKDLTQEFFLWMAESGFLEKVRPGMGCFRGFLKTALSNFLTDQHRASHRLKRGGAANVVPLDLSEDVRIDPSDERHSPEQELDRRWKESVIAQAMERVEADYRAQEKQSWVELWKEYDLSPHEGRLDYTALAEKYRLIRFWDGLTYPTRATLVS